MKLFADDAKVYKSISSVNHVHQVQSSVDEAVTWSNIWEMLFNFKKCKHLHIGSRYDSVTYKLDSEQGVIEIEKVTSEKDLGVIVDEALNFSEHISTKVKPESGYYFLERLHTWIKKCS